MRGGEKTLLGFERMVKSEKDQTKTDLSDFRSSNNVSTGETPIQHYSSQRNACPKQCLTKLK